MKKYFLILFCFLADYSFGQITFQKKYGTGSESIFRAYQTSDDGYLLCGNSSGFGASNIYLYLIKIDMYGDTIWTVAWESGMTTIKVIPTVETSDHGFVVAWESSDSLQNYYCCLLKLDSLGNEVWNKRYWAIPVGFIHSFIPLNIKQTSESGFIITGAGNMGSNQLFDIILMKTDSAGNVTWCQSYAGPYEDEGNNVIELQDGYAIYGVTNRQGNSRARCLLKTDLNGNLLWSWHYGGNPGPASFGNSIQKTQDGGFILITYGSTPVVTKTDSLGIPIWSVNYWSSQGLNMGNSIAATSDGSYILAGTDNQISKAFVIKIDSVGSVTWGRYYGFDWTSGNNIEETSDGGFILSGDADITGDLRAFLVKTDSSGLSNCLEGIYNFSTSNVTTSNYSAPFTSISGTLDTSHLNLILVRGGSAFTSCFTTSIANRTKEKLEMKVAPNPFQINATFTNEDRRLFCLEKYDLKIFNSIGTLIRTENNIDLRNYILNRKEMVNGLYFYELNSSSDLIATGKFIIE